MCESYESCPRRIFYDSVDNDVDTQKQALFLNEREAQMLAASGLRGRLSRRRAELKDSIATNKMLIEAKPLAVPAAELRASCKGPIVGTAADLDEAGGLQHYPNVACGAEVMACLMDCRDQEPDVPTCPTE